MKQEKRKNHPEQIGCAYDGFLCLKHYRRLFIIHFIEGRRGRKRYSIFVTCEDRGLLAYGPFERPMSGIETKTVELWIDVFRTHGKADVDRTNAIVTAQIALGLVK